MSLGHGVVRGRGDFDDAIVLDVQGQGASHAAVRADGLSPHLGRLVPPALLAQVMLALEHESTGGADADAVAAEHASGIGQGTVELGGDASLEAPPGYGDGEGILSLFAARIHAAIAENAAGQV